MRVGIDLQVLQWPEAWPAYAKWISECLPGLVAALRTQGHEVVLLADARRAESLSRHLAPLNAPVQLGHLVPVCAAALPANLWRRRAAHAVRTAWLESLALDALVVLHAQLGWYEDTVVCCANVPTVWLCPDGAPAEGAGILDLRARVWTMQELVDSICGALRTPAVLPRYRPAITWWHDVDLIPPDTGRPASEEAAARRGPRPRLAFVAPVPPARSGIADYSADLLPALARHYEIDLIIDQPDVDTVLRATYAVRTPDWFDQHAHGYDRILYHFGNSPFHGYMAILLERHPGSVVLHDFYLGHLYAHLHHTGRRPEALRRALLWSHGWEAVRVWRHEGEHAALAHFPCSLEVFGRADGVIVHSGHALALARQWYGHELPCAVAQVPLAHRLPDERYDRQAARRQLGLGENDFVVCSFGYVGAGKRSADIVEAWLRSSLARDASCRLVFVGGHQMEDDYARRLESGIREAAQAGIVMTGYVDAATYRLWLAAADVAIQLRAQSRGETSRAVLDAMGYAVPVIVNAHGAAAELPAECVAKLPEACTPEQIAAQLEASRAPEWRQQLGAQGQRYVATVHDPDRVAERYVDAIEHAAREGPRSGAGRARTVISRLRRQPGWMQCGGLFTAADRLRLSQALLFNHPQPQRRCIPPPVEQLDTLRPDAANVSAQSGAGDDGLDLRRLPAMEACLAGNVVWHEPDMPMLRGLLLVSVAGELTGAVARAALQTHPNVVHARQLQRAYDLADMPVDLMVWDTHAEMHQQDAADRLRAAVESGIYAFVHFVGSGGWPVVCAAMRMAESAGKPVPALIYGSAMLAAPAVQAEDEAGLARAAQLLLAACDEDAVRFARLSGRPDCVYRYRPGAEPAVSNPVDMESVYRQYLPAAPYVLWEAENDDSGRAAWESMFSCSTAFLRPDERMIIAGSLAAWLESSLSFNRWAGINRARCILMPRPESLALDTLRRYAHVRILPWTCAGAPWMEMVSAQAVFDEGQLLVTSVALAHIEGACRPGVPVADEPHQFRAMLSRLLQRAGGRDAPGRGSSGSHAMLLSGAAPDTPRRSCGWHVRMLAVPSRVRRAVLMRRLQQPRAVRA